MRRASTWASAPAATSVKQETIHKLMIRAARHGKHVVRLKGGDPFVFGRGAEEAIALAEAGIPFEIVPGVTTAVAAAELAGIPVTHRGVASGFVVLAGHTAEALDGALGAIAPNSLTVVVMMAVAGRAAVAERLMAHGWAAETPAAIVCGASTPDAWSWTGRLHEFEQVEIPDGVAGVLIVGDVVTVRAALLRPARARARDGGRDGPAGSRGTGGELWPQLTNAKWWDAAASTLRARRTSTSSSRCSASSSAARWLPTIGGATG